MITKTALASVIKETKDDPVTFVRRFIKANPTFQQEEVLRAIAKYPRVAVKAGHGVGKSALLSWTILWYLTTRPMSRVPITAPTMRQLKDILWSELNLWLNRSPFLRELMDFTETRLAVKGPNYRKTWFATPVSARKPENLQGFHNKNILFAGDEASGLPDENFEVIEGALTTANSKMLLIGNPTQPSGYFFDAFNKNRDEFHCITLNSLDSPLVTKEYADGMARRYGKDSNIYRVRVLGEFPLLGLGNNVIPSPWVEKAIMNDVKITEGRRRFGIDVARYGDDETVVVIKKGFTIEEIVRYQNQDEVETANKVMQLIFMHQPDEVVIETGGIGAGVFDILNHKHLPTKLLQFSPQAVSTSTLFLNAITEAWWNLRTYFQPNTESGFPLMSMPPTDEAVAQISSRRYIIMENGRIRLEDKSAHKKREGCSPDIGDALAIAFYDGNLKSSDFHVLKRNLVIGSDSEWEKFKRQ